MKDPYLLRVDNRPLVEPSRPRQSGRSYKLLPPPHLFGTGLDGQDNLKNIWQQKKP